MARLILLNGAPAVGKSTLARRYVDEHPPALLLDIDELRRSISGWWERDETKVEARATALAIARSNLEDGRDVVVPQLVARTEALEELATVARSSGAVLVEVLLDAPVEATVERFSLRRVALRTRGEVHPEQEIADADVAETIAVAAATLDTIAAARPATLRVTVSTADGGYASLVAVLR